MAEPASLIGNIGGDIKTGTSKTGKAYATFSLALYGGKDEKKKSITVWVSVMVSGELALTVVKKLHKGDNVCVRGVLNEPKIFTRKDKSESSSYSMRGFVIERATHEFNGESI